MSCANCWFDFGAAIVRKIPARLLSHPASALAYGVRRVLAALRFNKAKRRGLAALHTLRDFGAAALSYLSMLRSVTGYGRGTQRQVLGSRTFSGMQLIIGQRLDTPGDLVVPPPIPCVDAVEAKPTASTTNSRVILIAFDM
jgi:hypothetical protein